MSKVSIMTCLLVVAGCQPSRADRDATVDGGGADSSVSAVRDASGPRGSLDAGALDAGAVDADAAEEGAIRDASTTADAAVERTEDAGFEDAGFEDAAADPTDLSRIAGWSIRKRLITASGADILLEEALVSLSSASPTPSRLVVIGTSAAPNRSWTAPLETYISDFCAHPSGAASVVLLDRNGNVSFVRLDQDLAPLDTLAVHDPQIANDPHVSDAGALDLVAKSLIEDAARLGCAGEDVVATVFTSWNSVIAYRASFVTGAWTEPERTLVEPPFRAHAEPADRRQLRHLRRDDRMVPFAASTSMKMATPISPSGRARAVFATT